MRWGTTVEYQGFDGGHDGVGVAAAADPHGQCLAGVFIDDVEQFQPAAVGGLIELEV